MSAGARDLTLGAFLAALQRNGFRPIPGMAGLYFEDTTGELDPGTCLSGTFRSDGSMHRRATVAELIDRRAQLAKQRAAGGAAS